MPKTSPAYQIFISSEIKRAWWRVSQLGSRFHLLVHILASGTDLDADNHGVVFKNKTRTFLFCHMKEAESNLASKTASCLIGERWST